MITVNLKPGQEKSGEHGFHDIQQIKFETGQVRLRRHSHVWRPPTDVFETEDAIIVRVEVAGMRESDFSIIIDGRYLQIRGVRADAQERRAYYQMEIPFGEFSAEVKLPREVVMDGAEAFYSNGFLRVVLPVARPRKIQVED